MVATKHDTNPRQSPAKRATEKKLETDLNEEIERLQKMLSFDREMAFKWLRTTEACLIGTDEVGRGCLAGPVVAAAVNLEDLSAESQLAKALVGLDDSKKLSAVKREAISNSLKESCRFAIAEASVEEINAINILRASLLAMKRAISKLDCTKTGAVILVDGNQKIDFVKQRQILVIGGDGISASIAAASVLAKVYRDNLMKNLHEEFPHYRWDSNKGYGSKDHRDAIQEHGLTAWHRKLFCSKLNVEQLSLLS